MERKVLPQISSQTLSSIGKNATYVCKHYMLTKKLNEKTKTRIPEYTYVPSNSILFSISPLFSLMTDVEARVICQCKPLRHYCCF